MKRLWIGSVALLLVAAGCDDATMQEIAEAGTPTGDMHDCEKLGFEPGSAALAQCMNTAATTRQAELDRLDY